MQKNWTNVELNVLKGYKEITYSEIHYVAKILKRTYASIEHQIRRLGIPIVKEEQNIEGKIKREKQVEIIKQLGQEIVDNFEYIVLPNYKPYLSKYAKKEETSILNISDVHLGMINEVYDSKTGKKEVTYNNTIFKQQLLQLVKGIRDIHYIESSTRLLKTLHINVLGDIITNDRIFPEQTFEIEKVVGLQIWDAVNFLIYLINECKHYYTNIQVNCVVGNHGRSMPNFYEEPVENNFEYFIYKVIEKEFSDDKRIKIIVPDTRRTIINIMGHRHLLEHGDSFRGSTENTIERQIKELYMNMGGFDIVDIGHFHKLKERELADNIICKQNGCWINKDGWAFKVFKYYSSAKQWFYGCDTKRVETWSYKLDFRG